MHVYIGFACMALYLYNIYYYPCRLQQKKLRICLLLTRVRRALPTLRYRSWSLLQSCLPQLWPQLRHCPQIRRWPQLHCSHLRHCWPLLCLLQLRHCSTGLSSATAPSSTCATAGPRSACPSSTAGPCSAAPTCATAGPSPMGNMAPSVLGASRSSAV